MFDILGELMVSSPAVRQVYLHGGALVVGVGLCAFTLARYREYKYCRHVLTEELNKLYSMGIIIRTVAFTCETSLVMADLIEAMATTRSRWYVLHLVVRSLRRTPVKEMLLDALHANKVQPLTGLKRLKALFTSAF